MERWPIWYRQQYCRDGQIKLPKVGSWARNYVGLACSVGANRAAGGGGSGSGPAVSVAVTGPLCTRVSDSGGGGGSRDEVVADTMVRKSCVNSVPGGRMESVSWSWRMTTWAGISRVPSARALLDRMICNICLVGFLPCSCRL